MDRTEVLVRLQETDTAAARAAKRLDEMPEKQAILATRHKATDFAKLRVRAQAYADEVAKELARLEDETATVQEKIAAEEARILSGSVTHAKELQHIGMEVESLKRRRQKLDDDSLALMEKAEKAAGQLAKVDAAIAQLEAKEAKLVENFKSVGGGLQTQIETLERRRTELFGMLDASDAKTYEALRESKGGVAVGRLEGTHCSACRFDVPGEALVELKAGPDVTKCPMCRRILVVRLPDEDQE